MPSRIHGILPIVYTPFDERGSIDEQDVRRLVNYLLESGAHGLAATGGASESHKLSTTERKWLAELVVSETSSRVPVIIGVSATNIIDAVDLASHAERAGGAAVYATPPLFGIFDYPALRHYYAALAEAVSIPIMIQDAQSPIAPQHMVRLSEEIPNIAYVKEEAPGSGHRISTLLQESKMSVLSGGSYLLDDLARGAVGAIPGSVGVADLCQTYNHYHNGDMLSARKAYDHFLPIAHWRRQFPLLGAKEILRRIGVFKVAQMREPAGQRLDEFDHRELTSIMEKMGPPF
jgi:dihydrodipicolinate synthase/N-acetylneuraminate lyase